MIFSSVILKKKSAPLSAKRTLSCQKWKWRKGSVEGQGNCSPVFVFSNRVPKTYQGEVVLVQNSGGRTQVKAVSANQNEVSRWDRHHNNNVSRG
jgi:hypothetical protein